MSLLACSCITTGTQAFATALPGSADPSRLGRTDQVPLVPTMEAPPVSDAKPLQTGEIVIPGATDVVFVLVDLKIEGMEAYEAGKFLGEYAHLVGRPVTLQQVVDVVNTINRTYKDDGYIFSRAFFPEQDITAGVVRIKVVEGTVANVSLQNTTAQSTQSIQPYMQQMAAIRPFNIKKFEHLLLVMNDLPGARFRSVLRQPEDKSLIGGIDIVLLEEKLPASSMIEANNFGSQYAGPWQLNASHDRPGVVTDYDQLSLRLSATLPWDEVKYGQLGYELPIAQVPGLTLNTSMGAGATASGSDLDPLDVKGYTQDMRIGFSYAAMLSRRTNWLMYLNFDAKNATSKILGAELYDDRLRVLRLSTVLQHIDDFDGSTLFSGEISKGLDLFGARETGSVNLSRADGHSDFMKATAQISRLQNLPRAFQMLGQISGQYAFDPLLSAEEFGHGGVPMGRGYDPSEITGDHGVSATLEIRYNGISDPWQNLAFQPYVFIDFGKVWQKGDNVENAVSALSTGFGGRIDYGPSTSMNILMALPLTLEADKPPKYANGESPRYLLSVNRRF